MQIGVRWPAGETPHGQVPDVLRETIAHVDATSAATNASWTLTWLEGRPRCERSDGFLVTLSSTNTVEMQQPGTTSPYDDDEDDDWLRG